MKTRCFYSVSVVFCDGESDIAMEYRTLQHAMRDIKKLIAAGHTVEIAGIHVDPAEWYADVPDADWDFETGDVVEPARGHQ